MNDGDVERKFDQQISKARYEFRTALESFLTDGREESVSRLRTKQEHLSWLLEIGELRKYAAD